jgi:hypothetical protein
MEHDWFLEKFRLEKGFDYKDVSLKIKELKESDYNNEIN